VLLTVGSAGQVNVNVCPPVVKVAAQAASHDRHGLELGLRGGWNFLATSAAADGHQQGNAKTVAHRANLIGGGSSRALYAPIIVKAPTRFVRKSFGLGRSGLRLLLLRVLRRLCLLGLVLLRFLSLLALLQLLVLTNLALVELLLLLIFLLPQLLLGARITRASLLLGTLRLELGLLCRVLRLEPRPFSGLLGSELSAVDVRTLHCVGRL
jgi:hypothetical protein